MELDNLKQDIVFHQRLRTFQLTFHTTWGLFSPKRIDAGSCLLAELVQVEPDNQILDLGCGYGALGLCLARAAPQGLVHLVDKDFVAIDYARKNARINRLDNTQIYLSNAFSQVPDQPFDLIVANLPANAGKELLTIMVLEAHRRLKPGGGLWVVTISGLRSYIRRTFDQVFGNYTKVKQGREHTVSLAVKAPRLS